MRTPVSSLLGFAAVVGLLFYLPRLLEGGGLQGIMVPLFGMGVLFGGALVLLTVNDWLMRRFDQRPVWQDIPLTLVGNLVVVVLLAAVAWRVHGLLFEVDFEGLLRRAYRLRFFVVALLAGLYVRLVDYRVRSQRAEIDNLRLRERESAARLAALQRKVDPHFLFNTLNTIGGAVRQDRKEESLDMIADLAGRYRYLLGVADRSLVSVAEEIAFVEAYTRLLGHRFGEAFTLTCELPSHQLRSAPADSPMMSNLLPPLSLQLLVENAVKHNQLSMQHPLHVRIEAIGDRLRVSNALRPKPETTGSGEGLANLSERYALLGGEDARPRIERKADSFIVTLQTFSPDEGTDR